MSQIRKEFIEAVKEKDGSISELCRRFEISRKTAYKFLARYEEEGEAGLENRSRAPLHHPNATSQEAIDEVLKLRRKHPSWGPVTLRKRLENLQNENQVSPALGLPSASTIGAVLHRKQLTLQRSRKPRVARSTTPLSEPLAPNHLWTLDIKGWYRLGDGVICYPVTLSDSYSRYLLRVRALGVTTTEVILPLLEMAFQEYGLPRAIRTDNGPPFATHGLAGLSHLSVWWYKLGIIHERIAPAHPEQNGRHERMHRTLKAEATLPRQANLAAQQKEFDRFVKVFNHERPHHALGLEVPARFYRKSRRRYPGLVGDFYYIPTLSTRRVRADGQLKLRGKLQFLSEVLSGELVGLEEEEEEAVVYFGDLPLAQFDARQGRWRPIKKNAPWPGPAGVSSTDKACTDEVCDTEALACEVQNAGAKETDAMNE